MMALILRAFWEAVVLSEAASEGALTEAGGAEGGLEEAFVAAEDLETTVQETTVLQMTALLVFAAEDSDFLEAVDLAGAEEAGLQGHLADEGAFDGAFEGTLDGALDGAFEGALAAEEAGLEGIFVTVLVEVPLMAVVVFVVTNSLPFAAVSEPATVMPLSGQKGLTGTAMHGVATKTGIAKSIGVGGGGGAGMG